MDIKFRIIMKLPLSELWTNDGILDHRRGRELSEEDIKEILPNITFAVADIGSKLQWIDHADNIMFWKEEVKPHLAEPGASVRLEEFPGEYFYDASEWTNDAGEKIFLLEMSH